MFYVEALDEYVFPSTNIDNKSVFLAGGITNCRDWQKELVEKFSDTDLTLMNPRRKDWPIDDPDASEKQINWEHYHLDRARAISFWFSSETVQPITLFELGKWLGEGTPLFIGVDPDYPRKVDVKIQVALETEIDIVDSIDQLAAQIKAYFLKFEV